jgi:glucose-6-phosphate 1-epimerase
VREKIWDVTSRIDSLEETTLTPRARILSDVRRNPFGKANSESETVVLEYENTVGNVDYRVAFRLKMTIQLTLDSLSMALDVANIGDDDMHFTSCLHPYFHTEDINNISIQGLAGLTYIDKVDGYREKLLNPSAHEISVAEEVLSFVPDSESTVDKANYFVDRVFKHADDTSLSLQLIDRNIGDVLEITKSASWPNWVVFNPWIEGKKGEKGPDFDDDGYKFMVCIEPAAALLPIVLKQSESWQGTLTLSSRRL